MKSHIPYRAGHAMMWGRTPASAICDAKCGCGRQFQPATPKAKYATDGCASAVKAKRDSKRRRKAKAAE
jgi:hypothetical protein